MSDIGRLWSDLGPIKILHKMGLSILVGWIGWDLDCYDYCSADKLYRKFPSVWKDKLLIWTCRPVSLYRKHSWQIRGSSKRWWWWPPGASYSFLSSPCTWRRSPSTNIWSVCKRITRQCCNLSAIIENPPMLTTHSDRRWHHQGRGGQRPRVQSQWKIAQNSFWLPSLFQVFI